LRISPAALSIKYKRHAAALSALTAAYLIGIAMTALAQNVTRSPEKWRPPKPGGGKGLLSIVAMLASEAD